MSATLPGLLAERARARPADLAIVVSGGGELTFGTWLKRSRAVACDLVERGVLPGDPVALHFSAASWPAFAISCTAVLEAGAVAVLVPAGLSGIDSARVVAASGAVGVLCSADLVAPPPTKAWVADPDEVSDDHRPGWMPPTLDPAGRAELSYALSPLARPRPRPRAHGDVAAGGPPGPDGWLVHTWAPGSRAGQEALAHVLARPGSGAATLARFAPNDLSSLVARFGAATCGLTPGLAVAVLDCGWAEAAGLGSLERVVLSGEGEHRAIRSRLSTALPGVVVTSGGDVASGDDDNDELPPAGASQLGMLWHEQLAPGSFNLPCLVRRYRGSLDVGAFSHAFSELARRHEPLRTTFELRGADPRLVVHQTGAPLGVVDLAARPPAERDAEVTALIAAATTSAFDLVDSALFAPKLVRLGADDHLLVVRLHHTAFDDWSVDVFRRELSTLYAAFVAGGEPGLPDPVPFSDVCRRQRARLDGAGGAAARSWWREQMDGAPFAVQLPLGLPGQLGPDRPGAGEPVRHDLDPDLARRVRALARRLRATPFMTVLAGFGVLVARRTARDDLVLASVVAGRGSTEVEPLIGCLTKKVLLRLRVDGDPSFAEVVARTRTAVLGALSHQDLPFEAVVQATLGRAAAAHGMAAQVPVVFQGETPQQARLALPGIRAEPFEAPGAARREQHFSARRDDDEGRPTRPIWGDGAYLGTFLLLSLLEAQEGLALVARGVFHRPAAELLLQDLEAVLEEVVTDPDRGLGGLAQAGSGEPPGDELLLRGVRLRRSRLEEALARCPGVAEVAVALKDPDGRGPRLVAYVVADRHPPPTLAQLRAALWAARPGSPWPAAAVVVDTLPRLADGAVDVAALPTPPLEPVGEAAPEAALLTALWSAARNEPMSPDDGYWQDFTFLQALAEARAAGLVVSDEQISLSRTPEMLAAAIAAAAG